MQILVVVAINQMRTLMTEVDKGSGRTAIVLGLVGPKGKASTFRVRHGPLDLKGKKAQIPLLVGGVVVTQLNLGCQKKPWGALSLLFDSTTPSNRLVWRKG